MFTAAKQMKNNFAAMVDLTLTSLSLPCWLPYEMALQSAATVLTMFVQLIENRSFVEEDLKRQQIDRVEDILIFKLIKCLI
jgi:hypothetical protein